MDISRGRHSKPTLQCRGKIGNNVAEHVVRHDDLKVAWLANHQETKSIYIKMARLNAGVPRGRFLEAALPQVSRISHNVGLIAHADFRVTVPASILKGVVDNAADAFAR